MSPAVTTAWTHNKENIIKPPSGFLKTFRYHRGLFAIVLAVTCALLTRARSNEQTTCPSDALFFSAYFAVHATVPAHQQQ